ncbi:MAG: hypothetical protein GX177_03075 [Firmicutes bacterium]|nr:hypothetical protein [Bacillota bacterium]
MNRTFCSKFFIIICALSIVVILYAGLNLFLITARDFSSIVAAVIHGLAVCLMIFFLWALRILGQVREEQKMKQEVLRAQAEYAKKMQVLMREQRNDILNAISVVTAYLQVGQYERAQNYLEFMAADQFDKCDYHSCVFPDDPWEKIVQQKQEQAKQHQIQFIVEQDAEPPTDEDVKRLIARLMANLVDDAFQAAGKIANPKVWLRYYADDQQLVLEVEHNNTKFKKPEQKGQGEHPNCGAYKLPICRQIASEVGGKLTVVKTGKAFIYRFVMPVKAKQTA